MTLHWHQVEQVQDVEAALASLAAVGVRMGTPLTLWPMTYYWDADANGVLVNIGSLKAKKCGEIIIRPRNDCTGVYLRTLVGAAAYAFREGRPGKRGGWTYSRRGEGFWWTNEIVRAPESDAIAQVVRAARLAVSVDDVQLSSLPDVEEVAL